MGKNAGVDLDDLDDLRHDLRTAAAGLQREIDEADHDVAELVAGEATSRAQALGGTAGHVAPSVGTEGPAVVLGGTAYPMAAGAEFGGQGRPTTQQFQPYRSEGYFLYPAIRSSDQQIEATYVDHIGDLMRKSDLQ